MGAIGKLTHPKNASAIEIECPMVNAEIVKIRDFMFGANTHKQNIKAKWSQPIAI
jgi:hypothetical protein